MRTADIARKTAETDIALSVCLDGTGSGEIQTGCGFLDHMLTLFARHGRFDLTIRCTGDTAVDDHHTTEDIAICLGQAFRQALGDKRGILIRHFEKPRIRAYNRITVGTLAQMQALIDAITAILEEQT